MAEFYSITQNESDQLTAIIERWQGTIEQQNPLERTLTQSLMQPLLVLRGMCKIETSFAAALDNHVPPPPADAEEERITTPLPGQHALVRRQNTERLFYGPGGDLLPSAWENANGVTGFEEFLDGSQSKLSRKVVI